MVEVWGIEIAQQALLVGVVTGLTYAVFAAGFVLVYRSTGVLNFAQGELGAFGVALMALLRTQYSIPYWFALVLSVLACTVIGAVIELTVVRRDNGEKDEQSPDVVLNQTDDVLKIRDAARPERVPGCEDAVGTQQ